jgi:hypothetical protein
MAVPKYFIHFREGDRIIEVLDSIELPNLNAAKAEAISSAREVLKNAFKSGERAPDSVVIADENGQELLTLRTADWYRS